MTSRIPATWTTLFHGFTGRPITSKGTQIRVGFVATNSITQGEQVPVVWGLLFGRYRVKIHFAHRTFPWESEARGKAHVHVVIIGFGASDSR